MAIDWTKPLLATNANGRMVTAVVGQLNSGAYGSNVHWIFVYHDRHSNRPAPEGVWFDARGVSSMSAEWTLCNAVPEIEPVDPDLIEAREAVCRSHHDRHPESPWHQGQAELVRSGRNDRMLDVLAAYEGVKAGRKLERATTPNTREVKP